MDVSHNNSIAIPGTSAANTVAHALSSRRGVQATPKDSTTTNGSSSSTGSDTSDITSSDFLTLLVSELQNQDPTQPADPNAYISQLVGVNSLQQLIQINSGLASVETPPSSSPSATANAVSGTDSGASANAVAATNSVSGTQSAATPNSIWGGATSS